MELLYIIINIVLFICLGLFIKNYFPSYMKEKGKNLATKEDIQEITRKTEMVQREFKEDFELFASDVQFKYDFYFKQYSKLYCKLYSIIMQSEYVRHFIYVTEGKKIPFNEKPFLQISPTKKTNTKMIFKENAPISVERNTEEIVTPISEFNFKSIYEYIIDNGEYATQNLLRIAVAYRFAYEHFDERDSTKNELSQLTKELVCCIIKEYNYFRKELKMEYDENELNTEIPYIYN